MTNEEILDAMLDGTLTEDGAIAEVEAQEGDADIDSEVDTEGTNHDANATEESQAPIASKNGEYTIPYEKLVEAREERNQLRNEVDELKRLLAERETNGSTKANTQAINQAVENLSDEGVDVSLFGDFSEESIAKGVAEITRRSVEKVREELKADLAAQLAPIQQKEVRTQQEMHFAEIYKAHPDADALVESAQLAAWKNSLPAFARQGVDFALAKGTAQDVIDVFSAFKAATKTAGKLSDESTSAATRKPYSLSEVPGAQPTDDTAQLLAAAGNTGALIDRMNSMTPDQIAALMDRI